VDAKHPTPLRLSASKTRRKTWEENAYESMLARESQINVPPIDVDITERLELLRLAVKCFQSSYTPAEITPDLHLQTIAQGISIANRYMGKGRTFSANLFVVSMLLASKLDDVYQLDVSDVVALTGMSTAAIVKAESDIAVALDYQFNLPNAYEFLVYYFGAATKPPSQQDRHMCLRACLFLMLFPKMYRWRPSVLARAIIAAFTDMPISMVGVDQECADIVDHLQRSLPFRHAANGLTATRLWVRSAYDPVKLKKVMMEVL
jgi:hypothetical protein